MRTIYEYLFRLNYKLEVTNTEKEKIITVANMRLIRYKINRNLTVWRVEVNGLLLNEYGKEADLLAYVKQVYNKPF
jgi:hypothetical protein